MLRSATASSNVAKAQRKRQYRARQKAGVSPGGVAARLRPPEGLETLFDAFDEELEAALARYVVDWADVPRDARPRKGRPGPRTRGKELQCEAFLAIIDGLQLPEGARVLDIGSGQGGLTLPLAAKHPSWAVTKLRGTFKMHLCAAWSRAYSCNGTAARGWLPHRHPSLEVVGVDVDKILAAQLNERAAIAGLGNARGWAGRAEDFDEAADLVVALHACGFATDIAVAQAVARRAPFVAYPCCLGKVGVNANANANADADAGYSNGREFVRSGRLPRAVTASATRLPRSDWLRAQMDARQFGDLCRAAEHADAAGRAAKAATELDRCLAVAGDGYAARMARNPHFVGDPDFAHRPHEIVILGYPDDGRWDDAVARLIGVS